MSDSDKPPNQHAGCRSEAAAFVARMIGAAAIGSMLGLLHWLLLPIPALNSLRAKAVLLGAEAVIGIDIDYMTVGHNMLMVVASGTAGKLQHVS